MLTTSLFTLALLLGAPAPRESPPSCVVLRDREFRPERPSNLAYLQEQINLIRGDSVLQAVLFRAEIARLPIVRQQKRPVEWLRQAVELKLDATHGLVEVRVNAGSKSESAALLSAVVAGYLAELKRSIQQPIRKQLEYEEREKQRAETDLVRAHLHLAALAPPPDKAQLRGAPDDILAGLAAIERIKGERESGRFGIRRCEREVDYHRTRTQHWRKELASYAPLRILITHAAVAPASPASSR